MKKQGVKRIALNFAPRPAQEEIFYRLTKCRFLTAVCHRRLGKTVGALAWLCHEGLTHKDTTLAFRGYFIAKTQRQARRNAWSHLKTILGPAKAAGLVSFNETDLRINLPNGGVIYLVGAEKDSIEDLRGIYAHAIVMDELASWRDPYYAFQEVIRPAMMDCQGRGLFIGTVKGLDILYDFFKRGFDDTFPEWDSVMFKASETGILLEKELDGIIRENAGNPAVIDRELECNFFAEVEDVLIGAKLVHPSQGRALEHAAYKNYPVKIGIDPGITGDPTEVCIRKGPMVYPFVQFNIADHEVLAQKIVPIINYWGASAVYVDTGRGEQLIRQLIKQLGSRSFLIRPVQYNAPSPIPACFNFRAFMYYTAKQWFMLPKVSTPADPRFLKEITNQYLDQGDNAGTLIKLIAKKKIAQMIQGSPNKADAFASTFSEGNEASEAQVTDRERSMRDGLLNNGIQKQAYNPKEHLKNKYRAFRKNG